MQAGSGRGPDPFSLKNLTTRGWRSVRYRLMRRQGEGWVQQGTYGSAEDAGEAADQAVGRGEGHADDYRVEEDRAGEPTWKRVLRRAAFAALILVFAAFVALIVAMFLR